MTGSASEMMRFAIAARKESITRDILQMIANFPRCSHDDATAVAQACIDDETLNEDDAMRMLAVRAAAAETLANSTP